MALKRQRGSNRTRGLCKLAIDDEMTIYAIATLKEAICEEMDCYDRFELHLGNVEEIDSAGIQLLLAVKNEMARRNKQFEITKVSAAVAKLFETYKLSDHFHTGAAA